MNKKVKNKTRMRYFIFLSISLVAILLFGYASKVSTNLSSNSTEKESEAEIPIVKPIKDPIIYDLSCLNDSMDLGTNPLIEFGRMLEEESLKNIGPEVTIAEEEKQGNVLLTDLKNKNLVLGQDVRSEKLSKMLSKLVSNIKQPRGYKYSICLIDSKELNAYTTGAKIFITNSMVDFCKSDDELACILGHEIYHNELGHIKRQVQKVKLLTEQGAALANLLTIPFGQHDETMCDLKGLDLAFASGYKGCVSVDLWKRFQNVTKEGGFNPVANLLRSHPFSSKRSECNESHILTNYGFSCSGQ
jgi:predicted Zn-dependent protease